MLLSIVASDLVVTSAAVGWGVVFGQTVTVHAPTHRQSRILRNLAHLSHITVTGRTFLTGANMHGVIEFYEFR